MKSGYKSRYDSLNERQKQAVDTIDGPVMVVAGPGTGKTELLSVRAAHILATTDTLPSSILCLTFTDNAAQNMRERLVGLIGAEAYKISIHTFHSFGSEIINKYSDFFYHGAHFEAADELTTHQILTSLLEKLPHDNPLTSTMNGSYTHIKAISTTISQFKRSGYTPDEINSILDRNDAFCEWAKPHVDAVFSERVSKKMFPGVAKLLSKLEEFDDEPLGLIGYHPLNRLIINTLQQALDDAQSEDSTKPLSAWKSANIYKSADGSYALKDTKYSTKLRAAASIYYDYLVAMQERELYDYDDMILRVVHAMEVFDELRFELQESYHYIMVDEFQDTNEAQMRILWNLTNNPVTEGRPNILVVGDDDQAIYRFQGAELSNILDFTNRYNDVQVITLTDNYRSTAKILDIAERVSQTVEDRLTRRLKNVDKHLVPHHSEQGSITTNLYQTTENMYSQLSQAILDDARTNPTQSRAVIARTHASLMQLAPYLENAGVPISYEYRENLLDSEPVAQLALLAKIIHLLSDAQFDDAQALLPELLSHPAWQLLPSELWQIALEAHRKRQFWVEIMLARGGRAQDIAEWLVVTAHRSLSEPLEPIIDVLFGANDALSDDDGKAETDAPHAELQEEFVSPLRAYFFPNDSLDTQPARYISWLQALQKLRAGLREYIHADTPRLSDFVSYIDLHRSADIRISARTTIEQDAGAVVLLSAHKSKGLEFDHVYLLDASDHVWGNSASTRASLIQYPSNVPLAPAGSNDDERARLLFVALTRAKSHLTISLAAERSSGKAAMPVASLVEAVSINEHDARPSDTIAALEQDWQLRTIDVPIATKEQLLRPLLERYQLSATHLNNYLNVADGGPELFLLHNLLRFPQAMSPSATYGSAIHAALQRAHAHLSATSKRRPLEDILNDFERTMRTSALKESDLERFIGRGTHALTTFLEAKYDTFTPSQIVERSFRYESIIVGDAKITGAIDLIDCDTKEKTIFITDYKTGKPSSSWSGKTPYEKIKLHHYEQQLMMYHLLISRSQQFAGYTISGGRLSFVEADAAGAIVTLEYEYNQEKLERFARLIEAVWRRIMNMDFSVDTEYPDTLQGIIAFEDDLLK